MKKQTFILFLLLMMPLYAQHKDIKFGISLCGGGALGFAHIGALEVIDSLGIPIDYVAGTSMGGLVGGLYAMGYSPQDMKNLVLSTDWAKIFNDNPTRDYLPYLLKRNSGKFQLELEFELKELGPKLPSGLIKGQNISLLFSKITYPFEELEHFDQLPIPFRCVGVDLITGKEIVFENGSLATAMRATMSIPSAFDPVNVGDTTLVIDGGVVNNFPVDVVKNIGADKVIGLNITFANKPIEFYDDMFKVLDRTTDIPRYAKLKENIDLTDYYIDEYLEGFSIADFNAKTIPNIIAQGKKAAYANLDKLLEVKAITDSQAAASTLPIINNISFSGNYYLSDIQLKRIFGVNKNRPFDKKATTEKIKPYINTTLIDTLSFNEIKLNNNRVNLELSVEEILQPKIEKINVYGLRRIDKNLILSNLRMRSGTELNLNILEDKIKHLYGLGYFNSIKYEINKSSRGKVSLNLTITEKSFQKFSAGFKYDDYYKLVGIIGFQSNSTFFKGFHFETEVQFSGLTKFNARLLYPSRSLDLPVYPFIYTGYIKIPREIYNMDGDKALSYDEKSWKFGGGIGISLWNFFNLEGRLQTETPDINVVFQEGTSTLGKLEITQNIVAADIRLDIDLIDDVLVPYNGLRVYSESEIALKKLGSKYYYERFNIFADLYKTFRSDHTLRMRFDIMRAWQDEPYYKTLYFIGGPETFVGINYFQAMGSQFNIFRAEYRYKLSNDLFIKGIVNTTFGYKLGFTNNTSTSKELFGFGIGVKYVSFLGPIELIFSRGDKNVYSVGEKEELIYFVMGYKF